MPRVSEEHLERRRRQILDAARACFIRKGVHATSMQDIFAESGLSAGAVYRYFKSKNDIVKAILGGTIGDIRTYFADIALRDPLPPMDEVVGRLADRLVELSGDNGPIRLAPQAWALAMTEPEIGHYAKENITDLLSTWVLYVRRLIDAGHLPQDADAVAVAKTLFGTLPGFLLQRLILEDITPDELRRGVRSLMGTGMVNPQV